MCLSARFALRSKAGGIVFTKINISKIIFKIELPFYCTVIIQSPIFLISFIINKNLN